MRYLYYAEFTFVNYSSLLTNMTFIFYRFIPKDLIFIIIMLKKIISIIIILLLVFYAGGFLILFNVHREIIEQNVKKRIDENHEKKSAVLIVVDKKDLEDFRSGIIWKRKYEEFKFNGKLYDVISIKKSGEHLLIYCWNDCEEEELFNNLCLFINKNFRKNHFVFNSLSFYIIPQLKNIPPRKDAEAEYFSLNNYYTSILSPVPAPPPRRV